MGQYLAAVTEVTPDLQIPNRTGLAHDAWNSKADHNAGISSLGRGLAQSPLASSHNAGTRQADHGAHLLFADKSTRPLSQTRIRSGLRQESRDCQAPLIRHIDRRLVCRP